MDQDSYYSDRSLQRSSESHTREDRIVYPKVVYSELPPPSQHHSSLSLIEAWRLIKRHPVALILFACLGLISAILYTVPQTPLFQARTDLEIQDINGDFLNAKQVTPVAEDSAENVLTDIQTQMKILQSQHLMARVIQKLKAEGKLGPLQSRPPRFEALRQLFKLAPPKPMNDHQMLLTAQGSLAVRQLGQTRMVEILYSSSDPQFAADLVNTLASEYIESNMESRWKMSERTGEWLAGQLDEMRVKLEHSEAALQDYAQKSGLLFTGPVSGNTNNVAEDKLMQIQQELSRAQADRAAAESRYEVAKSAPPDTVADVLNDKPLRDLQDKLTDLRRQQADLLIIYTANHEKVRRVQAQIAPLELAFNTERAAVLGRIENDYQAALDREKLLTAAYNSQSSIVNDQAAKSIQYNILKREVDSNRQIYETISQQVKEASVASAMRASNIRVVDPADPPDYPYAPRLSTNCVFGLLSGAVVGVLFVFLRERADRTLQQPSDAESWTNVPELGVIPSARFDVKHLEYNEEVGEFPSNGIHAAEDRKPQAVELLTWRKKPSIIAEAFRTVLTSILFASDNGSRPRVLVMTSGNPGDGKTTVTTNLAIAAAEIHRRVLIVDADLRRPRMHQLFELPNDRGLSTLLEGPSLRNLPLEHLVQPTDVPNLWVLTGGPPTPAASRLLFSSNFAELIIRFREEFDMVFIDTPPALHLTDARVAARSADGVVLVARAGQTTKEVALAISNRFSEDRTKVLGTVLNDWNPKSSPTGYYGYQARYFGAYRS